MKRIRSGYPRIPCSNPDRATEIPFIHTVHTGCSPKYLLQAQEHKCPSSCLFVNEPQQGASDVSHFTDGQSVLTAALSRNIHTVYLCFYVLCDVTAPSGSRPPYCWGFTITLIRTPLEDWSARRKYLYLTTHNIQNRHPCPRRDLNPQSQQACGHRLTL
jgi:hypothetical protein